MQPTGYCTRLLQPEPTLIRTIPTSAPLSILLLATACAGGSDGRSSSAGSDDSTSSPSDDDGPGPTTNDDGSTSAATASTGPADTTSSGSDGSDGSDGTTAVDGSTSGGVESTGPAEGSTDDGSSSGGAVDDDTVYEIQDGTIATGTDVDVRGVVVTGVASNAIFVQESAGGEYSGVYVYLDAVPAVEVGDEVDILGVTAEFGGLTEIDASGGSVTATGTTGIDLAPDVITADEIGEPWESVLVRIEAEPLVVIGLAGEEFVVDADGAEATIDDFLYSVPDDDLSFPFFWIDAGFTAIQGPLNFFDDQFKIAPRTPADLEGYIEADNAPFGVDDLLPGDLIVTEVMANPTCPLDTCEWIEIFNNTDVDVNLQGLRIQDDATNEGIVDDIAVVGPFSYAVIAANDVGEWPYALAADGYFGALPSLTNTGNTVVLLNDFDVLDEMAPWSNAPSGRSWSLDPFALDPADNDVAGNWCYSDDPLVDANVAGEHGTPGADNGFACN